VLKTRKLPRRSRSRFIADSRSILMEVKGHSMLRKPQTMTTTPKPHNTRKYY